MTTSISNMPNRSSAFSRWWPCAILLILALNQMTASAQSTQSSGRPSFVIAVHGGAGAMDPKVPAADRQAYINGLTNALNAGRNILAKGGTSLDAVEAAVRVLEDDENFNAGKGAVYNIEGFHELDACIMDGQTLDSGGVTCVTTVRNPISLARLIMEKHGPILLSGTGAEQFATEMGVPRVDNHYFDTPRRYEQLQKKLEELKSKPGAVQEGHGTVGAVALDMHGHLAAATSTGGLTGKRLGRVGDTPIPGDGNYANDNTVAVSGTGVGEQFMRYNVGYDMSARMAYLKQSVAEAANSIIRETLPRGKGGLIAIGRNGDVVTIYNTPGMFRGVSDSNGRFEVHIGDEGTGDAGPAPITAPTTAPQ